MFSLLNPGVWLACGLALAASYGAGRWHQYQASEQAQKAAIADATAEARRIESKRAAHVQEVQSAYAKQVAKNRADADAAKSQLASLHNALDRDAEHPGPPVGADDPAVLRLVVRQCSSSLTKLGEVADQHEATIRGLQAWVRGVLLIEPSAGAEAK